MPLFLSLSGFLLIWFTFFVSYSLCVFLTLSSVCLSLPLSLKSPSRCLHLSVFNLHPTPISGILCLWMSLSFPETGVHDHELYNFPPEPVTFSWWDNPATTPSTLPPITTAPHRLESFTSLSHWGTHPLLMACGKEEKAGFFPSKPLFHARGLSPHNANDGSAQAEKTHPSLCCITYWNSTGISDSKAKVLPRKSSSHCM